MLTFRCLVDIMFDHDLHPVVYTFANICQLELNTKKTWGLSDYNFLNLMFHSKFCFTIQSFLPMSRQFTLNWEANVMVTQEDWSGDSIKVYHLGTMNVWANPPSRCWDNTLNKWNNWLNSSARCPISGS